MTSTTESTILTQVEGQTVAPGKHAGFVRRFRRRPVAVVAFCFLSIMFAVALFTFFYGRVAGRPFPFDPIAQDMTRQLQAPGTTHIMGTDQYGRDVFARVLHASYISMFVGFVAVGIELVLGISIGAAAGYFGGWLDNVLMRVVDALMCIPSFLLILTIVAVLGQIEAEWFRKIDKIWIIIVAIGLLGWMGLARLVRAEFLTLREADYVSAARALGVPAWRIIFRHILPNALAPVFVSAVLGIAGAILTEAGLSFLGFGVQPPNASWGNIITDGKTYLLDAWWLIIFPGLAILLTTMAFYLTGEGIREVLDPKESKRI